MAFIIKRFATVTYSAIFEADTEEAAKELAASRDDQDFYAEEWKSETPYAQEINQADLRMFKHYPKYMEGYTE
jgi:hypothetical protein